MGKGEKEKWSRVRYLYNRLEHAHYMGYIELAELDRLMKELQPTPFDLLLAPRDLSGTPTEDDRCA